MKTRIGKLIIFLNIVLILSGCITIDEVEEDTSFVPGQLLNATISSKIQAVTNHNGVKLIFAVLTPKSWQTNKSAKVKFASNKHSGIMHCVSTNEYEVTTGLQWSQALKTYIGIGGNCNAGDLVWTVFTSDSAYNTRESDKNLFGKIFFSTRIGDRNSRLKIAYFVGDDADGLKGNCYGTYISPIINVNDHHGAVDDYYTRQMVNVEPILSSPDDLITFVFNGNIVPNKLSKLENNVYFKAICFFKDGEIFETHLDKNRRKMTPMGDNRWEITIWPKEYFALNTSSNKKSVSKIEYFLTNESGSITIGSNGGIKPFIYNFEK